MEDKNDALFFDAVLKGNMKQAKWFFDKGADIRKPSGEDVKEEVGLVGLTRGGQERTLRCARPR